MKKLTLTKEYKLAKLITKKHEGKWVALSQDQEKIIGYSEDLLKLKMEIGDAKVIYTKPLPSDVSYAFSS